MERINQADIIKASEQKNKKQICPYCKKKFQHKKYAPHTEGIWMPDCECEKKRIKELENLEKLKQNRKKLRERYRKAGFPPIYRKDRFKNLTCEHKAEANGFIQIFRPKRNNGFHFVGSVGSGKTTLAICIGKELLLKGYTVKFMTFARCIRLLQSTYSNKNPMTFDEQLCELLKVDLLILDDFGREVYKEKALENAFDLFNSIYNNRNNVILTSNPEMIDKVTQIPDFKAMLDRLHQMARYKRFNAQSFRRMK